MNKVLVIGEQCTDIFVYGTSKRKSPEGNAAVFIPIREVYGAGMAANTAKNLAAMKLVVQLVSDYGNITKTRYVDEESNKLYLRVDENDSVDRIDINSLPDLQQFDAIVISDYCKGFLSEDDIAKIASMHQLVILDTKKKLGEWCNDIKFIKVNRSEYNNNKQKIKEFKLESKIIATMDKDGAMYLDTIFPATTTNPIDICGAGDTFVAAFSKQYIETKDIHKSIEFANEAAGFVVMNKGVTIYSDLKN